MEDRHFYSALAHMNDMYGIDMRDDVFENIAMHAWDHIGNKKYQTYTFRGQIVNKELALPCNVDIIEAVSVDGPDVRRSSGMTNDGQYIRDYNTEQWIDGLHPATEDLTPNGSFHDYVRSGNTLKFKQDHLWVSVLYKGVLADDDGLPSINFKEMDAIAKYCAFVDTQKKAFISKDKNTFEMAMMLKQQWQFACDDARTPIYLNQNDMDNILNVASSWDRKRFGLTFKSVR